MTNPPRPSSESRWLVPAGALLLCVMTCPAFDAYFFGENFTYLKQFHDHGDHFFRALFSATDVIFFRPLFFAASLPWHFVLPQDPLAFHLRNFVFSVINLWLFHRLLLRLVSSRAARLTAFFLFALSKVHLTTIGYINIFDSIVMLMLLLATLLFFTRFVQERRRIDYALGLAFAVLSMFTKDHGVVMVAVVMALIGIRRSWPLVIAAIAALVLRFAIAGSLPTSNPTYTPRLSFDVVAAKLAILTSTIGNISFFDNGVTGASATSLWIAIVLYFCLIALLLITLIAGRSRALIFPLVWIAVYFTPTLLNRNLQIYYAYEALAGIALLVGLCLDSGAAAASAAGLSREPGARSGRRSTSLQWAWIAALVVIFANGLVGNYKSDYNWQLSARAAESLKEPLIEKYRDRAPDGIVFVTASRPFWEFTLQRPMLQELLHSPRLDVRFIGRNEVPRWQNHLIFDLDRRTLYAESSDPTQ
jgi:uncharacterized membrane protein YtjA (UPF0391 family)